MERIIFFRHGYRHHRRVSRRRYGYCRHRRSYHCCEYCRRSFHYCYESCCFCYSRNRQKYGCHCYHRPYGYLRCDLLSCPSAQCQELTHHDCSRLLKKCND